VAANVWRSPSWSSIIELSPPGRPPMPLTPDDLALLLKTFERTDWTEMTFSRDGLRVSLAKGDPPRPVATPPPAPAKASPPEPHRVRAGSVGILRLSTSPDAGPLAAIGQRVDADDVIGFLEVFRRRDEIRAGKGGIVRSIDAQDGGMVEYGQLLFTIEPDGR
jgi:acetyl-CoA carboxylase biotin carboxyl carrier protein